MKHRPIQHGGQVYVTKHLEQAIMRFDWVNKNKRPVNFSVRVRYSNHCYSKSEGETVDASFRLENNRVFCPDRYFLSLNLPDVIGTLFSKPTVRVGITHQHNCHLFQISPAVSLPIGMRYAIFFSLRRSKNDEPSELTRKLDLYVESAYARSTRVNVKRNMPFGKLAENLL